MGPVFSSGGRLLSFFAGPYSRAKTVRSSTAPQIKPSGFVGNGKSGRTLTDLSGNLHCNNVATVVHGPVGTRREGEAHGLVFRYQHDLESALGKHAGE